MPNKPTIPLYPPQGIQAEVDTVYLFSRDAMNQFDGKIEEVKELAEATAEKVGGFADDIATAKENAQQAIEGVNEVKEVIPAQASADNQLADKNFVNSSIQTSTANFRGNWPTFADIPSDVNSYPEDYAGSRTPTINDYLVVQKDETHNGATWRYKYTGNWATEGKTGWQAEYEINETPLTANQLAALNSGITAEAVSQIDTNRHDISDCKGDISALEADKQDKLIAGENITIEDNVISATGGSAGITWFKEYTQNAETDRGPWGVKFLLPSLPDGNYEFYMHALGMPTAEPPQENTATIFTKKVRHIKFSKKNGTFASVAYLSAEDGGDLSFIANSNGSETPDILQIGANEAGDVLITPAWSLDILSEVGEYAQVGTYPAAIGITKIKNIQTGEEIEPQDIEFNNWDNIRNMPEGFQQFGYVPRRALLDVTIPGSYTEYRGYYGSMDGITAFMAANVGTQYVNGTKNIRLTIYVGGQEMGTPATEAPADVFIADISSYMTRLPEMTIVKKTGIFAGDSLKIGWVENDTNQLYIQRTNGTWADVLKNDQEVLYLALNWYGSGQHQTEYHFNQTTEPTEITTLIPTVETSGGGSDLPDVSADTSGKFLTNDGNTVAWSENKPLVDYYSNHSNIDSGIKIVGYDENPTLNNSSITGVIGLMSNSSKKTVSQIVGGYYVKTLNIRTAMPLTNCAWSVGLGTITGINAANSVMICSAGYSTSADWNNYTNTEPGTFCWTNGQGKYTLFNADGTIPDERIPQLGDIASILDAINGEVQ